jgi:hypothetical protein
MERSQVLDAMPGQLKLYGMRTAYDEIIAKGASSGEATARTPTDHRRFADRRDQ